MIRLLLLLSAAIFITLQIAGQDRGQEPLGLTRHSKAAPAVVAPASAETESDGPVERFQAALTPAAFSTAEASTLPPAQTIRPQTRPGLEALVLRNSNETMRINETGAPNGSVQFVSGRNVNLRAGPSTSESVIAKLSRGEAVTVVATTADGWAHIRMEGDGGEGYIALNFLSPTSP